MDILHIRFSLHAPGGASPILKAHIGERGELTRNRDFNTKYDLRVKVQEKGKAKVAQQTAARRWL